MRQIDKIMREKVDFFFSLSIYGYFSVSPRGLVRGSLLGLQNMVTLIDSILVEVQYALANSLMAQYYCIFFKA